MNRQSDHGFDDKTWVNIKLRCNKFTIYLILADKGIGIKTGKIMIFVFQNQIELSIISQYLNNWSDCSQSDLTQMGHKWDHFLIYYND